MENLYNQMKRYRHDPQTHKVFTALESVQEEAGGGDAAAFDRSQSKENPKQPRASTGEQAGETIHAPKPVRGCSQQLCFNRQKLPSV